MMLETAKVILDFGISGILLAVLVGLYVLAKTFVPQAIEALVSLAGSLARIGERIESFGEKLDNIGLKVDEARSRASESAQESTLTREAFRTGSYPAVTAPAEAPPAAPQPRRG